MTLIDRYLHVMRRRRALTSSSSMDSLSPSRAPVIVSNRLHRSLASPIPLKFICLSYFTRNPNTIGRNTKFKPKPNRSGQNLEMVIDVDRIKQDLSSSLKSLKLRTRYEYRRFVNSGIDAFDDLRNMIVVDDGRRIMISCRRSTVMFVGNLVLWSFIACLGFRVLMGLVMWFRRGLGFGKGGGEYIIRRDRSLGGKEVVVPQGSMFKKIQSSKKSVPIFHSPVFNDVLREGMGTRTKSRLRNEEKLPGWFPVSVSQQQQPLTVDMEEGQRMANQLVRAIMDAKVNGRDVSEDDMIELRRICRTYRARANFDTANARDSFYRRCIDLVLSLCSRIRKSPAPVLIDGEDPRWFIAGLGNNLGIENTQAARMMTAAIAARTRSSLLQAWALELQQKHTEAVDELTKICMLHQIFPPEESSPEMEMVARGLQKQLKVEHRQFLLNMLADICGNEKCGSMAEALGLNKEDWKHDLQIRDAAKHQS